MNVESYAYFFIRRRKTVLSGIGLLTLLAVLGYRLPEPVGDEYQDSSPDIEESLHEELSEQFDLSQPDCFLVIDTKELFSAQGLTAIRSLVRAVRRLEFVDEVFWIDDLPVLNVFGLGEPLLPAEGMGEEVFRRSRERTMSHPLVNGQFLSPCGNTLLLPVSLDWYQVPAHDQYCERLLDVARRAASRFPSAGIHVQLTGRVPLWIAQRQAFVSNHRKFQIIGYVLVFCLAAFLFRGVAAVVIVGGTPAVAMFWTNGMLKLLMIKSNHLTEVVLPVLITMVGLTDGVHLMMSIRRSRAQGLGPVDAVAWAVRHVGVACALTSLTTAIGFASLLVARSELIQDFGVACSVGVVITFFAIILLIPLACGTLWGQRAHQQFHHDPVGQHLTRYVGVIDFVLDRAPRFATIGVAVTLGLAAIACTLQPDARTTNALPRNSEAVQAVVHCNRVFGGNDRVRIAIQWPVTMRSDDAVILQVVQRIEQIFETEDLISHPLSIRNLLASLSNDASDLADRMSLLTLLPEDLLDAFHRENVRRTLVVARVQDLGIATYAPVFDRIKKRLIDLEHEFAGFQIRLTGAPVLIGRDLTRIVHDLVASLGTASVVILIVMSCVYRSLRIGLITVVPNMFPLVLTGAWLALTGQTLTIVSVCAFTICIGIAVDDTIHFLSRFLQELAVDDQVRPAMRRTFLGVGSSLIMTTMILVTGFATVLISPLPTHRMFASMACWTILAALIGDLVFLPALLLCFVRRPRETNVSTSQDN